MFWKTMAPHEIKTEKKKKWFLNSLRSSVGRTAAAEPRGRYRRRRRRLQIRGGGGGVRPFACRKRSLFTRAYFFFLTVAIIISWTSKYAPLDPTNHPPFVYLLLIYSNAIPETRSTTGRPSGGSRTPPAVTNFYLYFVFFSSSYVLFIRVCDEEISAAGKKKTPTNYTHTLYISQHFANQNNSVFINYQRGEKKKQK